MSSSSVDLDEKGMPVENDWVLNGETISRRGSCLYKNNRVFTTNIFQQKRYVHVSRRRKVGPFDSMKRTAEWLSAFN